MGKSKREWKVRRLPWVKDHAPEEPIIATASNPEGEIVGVIQTQRFFEFNDEPVRTSGRNATFERFEVTNRLPVYTEWSGGRTSGNVGYVGKSAVLDSWVYIYRSR